ncbi:MAG: anti-sigma regulatory factor [Verrucomicrobiota bacterium]|nr:anti-sigma regulatory factor [Verrucomicrobiota bacterium]
MENNELRVAIGSAADIVTARQRGRALAMEMGFDGSDLTLIATAISEVARNIVIHAKQGIILLGPVNHGSRRGIQIVARDEGPGIKDVAKAMQYGYSTKSGLGVGLPGAKWLMDEFDIASSVGKGTVVTMKKWLH